MNANTNQPVTKETYGFIFNPPDALEGDEHKLHDEWIKCSAYVDPGKGGKFYCITSERRRRIQPGEGKRIVGWGEIPGICEILSNKDNQWHEREYNDLCVSELCAYHPDILAIRVPVAKEDEWPKFWQDRATKVITRKLTKHSNYEVYCNDKEWRVSPLTDGDEPISPTEAAAITGEKDLEKHKFATKFFLRNDGALYRQLSPVRFGHWSDGRWFDDVDLNPGQKFPMELYEEISKEKANEIMKGSSPVPVAQNTGEQICECGHVKDGHFMDTSSRCSECACTQFKPRKEGDEKCMCPTEVMADLLFKYIMAACCAIILLGFLAIFIFVNFFGD